MIDSVFADSVSAVFVLGLQGGALHAMPVVAASFSVLVVIFLVSYAVKSKGY